jgi:hypothetical protein
MSVTVYAGSTVRITNNFYNFAGELTDPEIVKVKIYDRTYKLETEHILADGNKLATGKYFFDYHTPTEPSQKRIIEFYGEIAGNPTFERETIFTTFLR